MTPPISGVVPLATVNSAGEADVLADGLVAGGLPVLEVALRNDYGMAAIERIAAGTADPPGEALRGHRDAFFGAGPVPTPVYTRDALLAGNILVGPALVQEHASTTVVLPGDRLEVDVFGNLVITVGQGEQ